MNEIKVLLLLDKVEARMNRLLASMWLEQQLEKRAEFERQAAQLRKTKSHAAPWPYRRAENLKSSPNQGKQCQQ